jgi:hypothetical protein
MVSKSLPHSGKKFTQISKLKKAKAWRRSFVETLCQ